VEDVVSRLRAAGCVFAEEEAELLLAAGGGELINRRCQGEPLEHLLGWVEFAGRRLAVGHGVFVPRRRSELLAREAVARQPAVLVELCCGAAALTAAVEAALPSVVTWASDIDPLAVSYAARNIRGTAVRGDLDSGLPPELLGQVDVIACNAPYVPTSDLDQLPAEARDHEPRLALDGGPDGLSVIRAVASCATRWLKPGGALLVEVSGPQAAAAMGALRSADLVASLLSDEMATAVVGVSTGEIADAPRHLASS
jgi:release factor glutamine methyltransferase